MNICLTIQHSPWSEYYGGAQLAVHSLAKEFTKMGHRVIVVYVVGKQAQPGDDVNYGIVWARDLSHRVGSGRLLNSLPVWSRVRSLLSAAPLDILHGSSDEAALLHRAARDGRCHFVMTAHRLYPKLKLLPSLQIRGMLDHFLMLLQRRLYHRAEKVFALSHFNKNNLIANLGIAPEKIEVVYHGVNPVFFQVVRQPDEREIMLTFWGRLARVKAIEILLQAVSLVSRRNDKLHLNLVGRGDLKYVEQCKKLAVALKIANKVSFIPWMDPEQLNRILAKTYLYVLSSNSEALPLAVLEAQAAGVPVICTSVGGIPEIVTDGETGLLVPPGDPEALAERILFAIDNPSQIERMAKAGRERIRENFTWEKIARRYCSIYESMLGQNPCLS
jgi:glycosyltransferase involved in cell wall biosynthesis